MTSCKAISRALLPLVAMSHAAALEQLDWFSVGAPGQAALHRADAGLLGQDESPSVLVDLAANGGSFTGIELSYQNDKAETSAPRWKRPVVDFGLETAIEALPGLVFALDAIDHHPKTTNYSDAGEWQLFDPQGGLRVGAGADLLRKWRDDGKWRWIVAGWIPVFSQTREWEARTGILWARKLRLDVSAGWSDPGIAARWQLVGDSLSPEDTVWWRSERFHWTVRAGGAPAKGVSLQAWSGQRTLRDPGAGDEPSWRTWGDAVFGGAQGSLRSGGFFLDLEARLESGRQFLTFDGSPVLLSIPDSGRFDASVGYVAGSSRTRISFELLPFFRPGMRLEAAWMDLEDAKRSGRPLPPLPLSQGSWSTAKRASASFEPSIRIRGIETTPSVGVQLRIRRGDALPEWQGMAPVGSGRVWSIPVSLRISRSGQMNGVVGYTASGEFVVSGSDAPMAGLRHAIELRQGF